MYGLDLGNLSLYRALSTHPLSHSYEVSGLAVPRLTLRRVRRNPIEVVVPGAAVDGKGLIAGKNTDKLRGAIFA